MKKQIFVEKNNFAVAHNENGFGFVCPKNDKYADYNKGGRMRRIGV